MNDISVLTAKQTAYLEPLVSGQKISGCFLSLTFYCKSITLPFTQNDNAQNQYYIMKIVGVTINWACNPTLQFDDGKILPKDAEMVLYKQYYPNGRNSWPVDPKTNEKLPIAK